MKKIFNIAAKVAQVVCGSLYVGSLGAMGIGAASALVDKPELAETFLTAGGSGLLATLVIAVPAGLATDYLMSDRKPKP